MKRIKFVFLTPALVVISLCTSVAWAQTSRWPAQKANAWYARQPWLIGSNYVPKSAINQLEMWQEATFDSVQIDKELTWAEAMGMNTMGIRRRQDADVFAVGVAAASLHPQPAPGVVS